MHRNTFVDAPRLLDATLAFRQRPGVRAAGQLTGTEGYSEAAASGLLAALNTFAELEGLPPVVLPRTTVLGALVAYATDPETADYQPMHGNFGLLPPLATQGSRQAGALRRIRRPCAGRPSRVARPARRPAMGGDRQ